MVAGRLDVVEHLGGDGEAVLLDGTVNDLAQLLLAAGERDLVIEVMLGGVAVLVHTLDKVEVLRDVVVEDDAADGRVDDLVAHRAVRQLLLHAHADGLVGADEMVLEGEHRLVLVAVDVEVRVRALLVRQLAQALAGEGEIDVGRPELVVVELAHAVFKAVEGKVVGAEHHILRRNGDGAAVLRTQEVVGGEHEDAAPRRTEEREWPSGRRRSPR